jgi:ADP-heptose:LPS heptosyltransferase
MPESSPSALLIRLDAIGDALATVPLVAALRAKSIPVDVVLRSANAGIFSSRAVRSVVVAEFDLRSGKRSNVEAIERLGESLIPRGYTHALVATEDPSGFRLALATRAPARIGFSNAWGKPAKTLWTRRFLTQRVYRSAGLDPRAPHECRVLFELGRPLLGGSAEPTRDPNLLRPLVVDADPPRDGRIAVQITDKWERLRIPFDDVVNLLHRLRSFGTLRLLAAVAEREYAERIAAATGCAVEQFAQIRAWKNAIAAAPALVTPDCGALHVAGMIGTPVVGVYPPSRRFALQVSRWAPWAAPHRIVRADPNWPARAVDALTQLL